MPGGLASSWALGAAAAAVCAGGEPALSSRGLGCVTGGSHFVLHEEEPGREHPLVCARVAGPLSLCPGAGPETGASVRRV